MKQLISEHLDIWTTAQKQKKAVGRGKAKKEEAYGIKKLRELILELAVRGKLVPQDPKDEPASVLLEKIAEEKQRLIDEGKIKKQKVLPEIGESEKTFNIPKSWEWSRLADAYYTISPSGKKLKRSEVLETGNYPVVDQGQSFITGYSNDEKLLIKIPGPIIIFGDHTKARKYIDFDFIAGADGTKILRPYNMDERYFHLYLLSYNLENRGYARHFKILNDNLIALPPLAEQHRIVAKVDELMALCDQLEQEQADHQATHQTLVKTLLNGLILRYGSLRHGSLRQAQGERSYSDCPELVEGHVRGNTVHPELVVRQAHHVRGNAVHPELVVRQAHHVRSSTVHPELVEGSALSPVSSELVEEHFDTLFTTEDSIDQLKQTILQLAVMGKLVPQNPKDEPASVLLEKISQEKAKLIKEGKIKKQKALPEIGEDEQLFNLSEGWCWVRLGNAGISSTGKTPSTKEPRFFDGKIPFIGPGQITLDGKLIDPEKYLSEDGVVNSMEASHGDILMVCIGGSIGKSVICNKRIAFNQQINAIKPLLILSQYLLISVSTSMFYQSVLEKSSGSATPIINRAKWDALLIPLPPLAEQHRIVTKVNQLLSLCDTLKAKLNQAQATQTQLADTIVKQAVN